MNDDDEIEVFEIVATTHRYKLHDRINLPAADGAFEILLWEKEHGETYEENFALN